jgi:hypothetical protein
MERGKGQGRLGRGEREEIENVATGEGRTVNPPPSTTTITIAGTITTVTKM